MIFLPFLHFFCFIVCFYLAFLVLYKDYKLLLNKACAILLLCFAFWNFGDIIIQNPDLSIGNDFVLKMQNFASIGWISFASALFCFSLAFSKKEYLLKNKFLLFIVIILPLFFLYLQWTNCLTTNLLRQPYGWSFAWADTIWTYLFFLYYFLFTSYSILIIYTYGRKTKSINERKQAKIITISVIVSLIVGTVFDVVIQELGIDSIPTIADLIILIFAITLSYSIVKYSFLTITPANAAENIISAMDELLILLNQEGNILNVNKATIDVLQYEQNELEGKSITMLFQKDDFKHIYLERITNKDSIIFTKNGKEIPITFSISHLKDEEGIINGTVFIARNITESKLAEEILRKSEVVQSKMIANIGDVIVIIDQDGINRYKSPNIEKWFGWKPEEVIGHSTWDNVHPDDLESGQSFINDLVLTHNATGTAEIRYQCKDRTYKWIEFSAVNLLEDPDIQGILGNYHDITDRKFSEETLRESEEKFRLAFKTSPESITINRLSDRVYIDINESFTAITGYTLEEVRGKTSLEIDIWENIQDRNTLIAGLKTNGRIDNLEANFRSKNDTIINGLLSATMITLNNESHYIVMTNDITVRKRAEDALSNSLSMLNATLESTADGLLVVDYKGIVTRYNQKFIKLWGIPKELFSTEVDETLLNYCANQLNEPDKFKSIVYEMYKYPENSSFDQFALTDGRIFERFSQPQRIHEEIVGRVWSFRDITERKKAEEELVIAKEKAEESDRLKTAFLANMNHEIRTPFNGILGFTELLKNDELTNEDRQNFIRFIEKSGTRLLNLLNDIFNISRIESGMLEVNISEADVNDFVEYAYDLFKQEAQEKGLQFVCQKNLTGEKAIIHTDSEKVYYVLKNIVENAIKFTADGRVELGCLQKDNYIEFFVEDTGCGISSEQQKYIYDRFRQGSDSLSRNYEGAGLGLSISRAYVEALGGKIWVESELGKGSTFYFRIPYSQESKENIIENNIVYIEGDE